jgi:hypothetical protein
MAQHFTFLSRPSIHAGLRPMKGRKGQKGDKDGLGQALVRLHEIERRVQL